MNKQKLQEYIKNYIQEKTYVGNSSIDDIEKDPDYKQLPSSTKMDVKKRLQKGETATLEEAEQNIRTSLQRLLLLSREIADSVEDADLDSPEIISLQSDVDNFVNTVLKPFYNKI